MTPIDDPTLKQVVDELANALQSAVLITTRLQARRGAVGDAGMRMPAAATIDLSLA